MTEPELIERLIAEAAQRGRTEEERDRLNSRLTICGDAMDNSIRKMAVLEGKNAVLEKQNADLHKELHEARGNEQKSLYMLHDIVEAAKAVSQKRRSAKAWLHLAGRVIFAEEQLDRWIPF